MYLFDWMQLLRDIALMYSKMFGAGIESVQIEKMQSGEVGKYRKKEMIYRLIFFSGIIKMFITS